jgi:hypothetical protein
VRLPVVFSIIAHVALLLIALRLPAAGRSRAKTIELEINEPKQTVVPHAPDPLPPEPPKALPKPQPLKNTQRHDDKEPEPPKTAPPPTQPEQAPPPASSSLTMRPSAPVDLNLHGLGGIVVNNGAVHGGEGGPAGTFGSAPKKPWKPRGDAGDPILGKLADEKEERFPLKLENDGYHYDGPSFSAKIAMDGRVTFDDHSIRDFKGLSGGFDLTDIAMRNHHQDPYRYEKERFMENTNKLRNELTTKARRDRLESSLAALPGHLEQIWSDAGHSARERRSVLYAMWREASGSDDEVGAAGKKARATIEAFIRDRLPEGSENAFTDDELRRFNARAGTVKFEPYRAQ